MKKQKKDGIYILALAAAFMLCACGGRASDEGIVQKRRGSGVKAEAAEQIQEEAATEDFNAVQSELYIITKIDTEQKLVDLKNVNNGRQVQYEFDVGTEFLDKYGHTKSAVSFLAGDVAEISLSSRTEKLASIQLSDEVWVQDDIVNYSVDESRRAFTIGQTKYFYDPEMDVFSGDAKVDLSGIGGSDVLRAVGLDKKLISLAVTKGHGYLALANTKLFEGSFICIGDRIFQEVTENMQIEVPEGQYLVTVANDGYGGSREVQIDRDHTTSLNLDELKGEGPKICRVTFDVSVEGAVLLIDGKKADYSAPVELRYGVHSVTVEAEGYDPITQNLVANSPEAEIEIALVSSDGSSAESGKSSEKKDSNDGSKNGNNSNKNNGNNNGSSNGTGNNNADGQSGGSSNSSGTGASSGADGDSSQSDYLTTLYNLLTSINNKEKNNSSANTKNRSSNSSRSYDDLRDE